MGGGGLGWWNHKGPVDICVMSWAREGGESVDSEKGVGGGGAMGWDGVVMGFVKKLELGLSVGRG